MKVRLPLASYSYNSVGELTTVTPSGTGGVPAVEYGYDPSGRVSTVTRQGPPSPTPTPVVTSAVYDAAGQLSSLQHSTSAGVLKGYAITRDVRGNPAQVDTTTSAGTTTALYSYDALSRLRTECYPATGTACVAKSPRNAYTYDVVGNRTSQTSRTVSGNKATTLVTDYAYDAACELLTESVAGTPTVTNTWTPNGALATSTTPAGTQTYTTDLTDELISLTLADGSTVGYTHDAQGNRTSRTVDGLLDATWAWDDLSSLPMRIGEYGAAGTLATAWLADPTSSTGASLAQTSGGVSSWLLSDPFANTVATVSTTGNTVSGTRTMDAFGVERTSATGSLADAAVGFAGQYLDDATGLYDMRARDYDPSSGRFTATDPVAVPTGMPYVAGYSYAFNNPLMLTDVGGNWPSGDDWYNAFADTVNGIATGLNYVRNNWLGLTLVTIGAALTLGAGAEEGVGALFDLTGVGAIVGVPLAVVGALQGTLGLGLVAVGGLLLIDNAHTDCRVEIMEHRSSGPEKAQNPSQKPSQKGTTFRGGKKNQRDQWYGNNDKSFQNWWHRSGTDAYGEGDIEGRTEVEDIYQDWIDMGRPSF